MQSSDIALDPQTCTLLTANRPSAMGHLYRYVTGSDLGVSNSSGPSRKTSVTESVNRAALIRESALKSVIFVGVPRVRFCPILAWFIYVSPP